MSLHTGTCPTCGHVAPLHFILLSQQEGYVPHFDNHKDDGKRCPESGKRYDGVVSA